MYIFLAAFKQVSVWYQVPTTVSFEALMLRFERFVSILQLRYKLLKLVLDAFWQLVQLGPLQNLEQDDRHLLHTRRNTTKLKLTTNTCQLILYHSATRPPLVQRHRGVKLHNLERTSALTLQNKSYWSQTGQ